jgi:hypothetical protein
MRPGIGAVIVVLLWCAPAAAAEAGTVFVVPGRPGVPVVINGWDASYSVVEGEFGLDRPGQVNPVIVGTPLAAPVPLTNGSYFPRFNRRPAHGRFEIEPPPNRRLPPPAEPFYRDWSSQSAPLPASLDPPAPISIDAEVDGDRDLRRRRHHRHHDRLDRHRDHHRYHHRRDRHRD